MKVYSEDGKRGENFSVEKRRPPLTTIFLWIVGVLTLVLTGYGKMIKEKKVKVSRI